MPLKLIKHTPKGSHAYTGPHYQVPLKSCQHFALNNPWLNAMYKPNISYVERWYLEIRRLILEERDDDPLLVFVRQDPIIRLRLVKSIIADAIRMREILACEQSSKYHMSASVNLRRLNRWCSFFISLDQTA